MTSKFMAGTSVGALALSTTSPHLVPPHRPDPSLLGVFQVICELLPKSTANTRPKQGC